MGSVVKRRVDRIDLPEYSKGFVPLSGAPRRAEIVFRESVLEVCHTEEAEAYLSRGIYVTINGERRLISVGVTESFETKPGSVQAIIDNTFQKKRCAFEVLPGRVTRIEIRNRMGLGSWMVMFLGAGPVYLEVRETKA